MKTKKKLRLRHQMFMLFFAVTLTVLATVAANAQHRGTNPQVRRDVHSRQDHNRRVVRAPVYYGNYANSGYYLNDGYYGNGQFYTTRRPTYYPPQRRTVGIGGIIRVLLGGGRSSHVRKHH
ncbi:MAG TPA: hypothetical protein PLL77_15745 [Pyrinomonadaceae bacterium]|nr:hypothetical protein [Pyrinomonadaceae bacterium]